MADGDDWELKTSDHHGVLKLEKGNQLAVGRHDRFQVGDGFGGVCPHPSRLLSDLQVSHQLQGLQGLP